MVNIVIVSHSYQLAAGVRELALQMVQDKVQIAIAGGIDDPEQPIGTDAMKVLDAIQSVFTQDGVLVLMDLGSALLSAETALEFLEPEQAAHVRMCPAPLVEGALAAAVQASVGGDLQAVFQEAMGALNMKLQQQPAPATPAGGEPVPGEQVRLTVSNRLGLHARPAARLVSTATRFRATIEVRLGAKRANAKSINQVATLGARQGDELVVIADGLDAADALQALADLAADNFGDRDEARAADAQTPVSSAAAGKAADQLTGIGASPGVAIGPLAHYRPTLPRVMGQQADDPQQEWERLQAAIQATIGEIRSLRSSMEQSGNRAEAEIFTAHELILRDPELQEKVRAALNDDLIAAPGAWQAQIEALAAEYQALDDDYMRARAGDVLDVGRRVLTSLLGLEPPSLNLAARSIVAARELTPSDTARFNPDIVLGICTELGGATSHSAILARAMGIPAIVGLGAKLASVAEGQTVAIDGAAGTLRLRPTPEEIEAVQRRSRQIRQQQERLNLKAHEAAITLDGRRIEMAANIGGPREVALALQRGAEGIGLFRTEFLFHDRESAPSEQEQVAAYREVAEAMEQRPVIIRTLDVGGDKPLPYLDLQAEDNPFLGWRGIRFCLDNPQLFLPQLRAILRAGAGHNIKIMLPMIGAIGEVRAAKELLQQARDQLRSEGQPFDDEMQLGIMIEVPAAVSIADQLAREVDFFSIGTNDLTQYVMAADRGNARVAALADPLQPAVLREVERTITIGHEAGIWVGMCGELAGNPLATALLVGLGLDELSMNAPALPQVKENVRRLSVRAARQQAASLLQLSDARAVTQALEQMQAQDSG